MHAAHQRNQVMQRVKTDAANALTVAGNIDEPWFRSQALAAVARYTDKDCVAVAARAMQAADLCDDNYKRSSLRAWAIVALAEREHKAEARKALKEAVSLALTVTPPSSKSEALYLLLQASFTVGQTDAVGVYHELHTACSSGDHWRCKRAVRDGAKLVSGELHPRTFF